VAIPAEDVVAVREATDLGSLIGAYVGLRPQGRRLVGLCPFHEERTPSFTVNPDLGVYHCFGCGASGDAISFLRAVEHLDFTEAVTRLAERAGVPLHQAPGADRAGQRRRRLEEVLAETIDFYHHRLLEDPAGEPARSYLAGRGVTADLVARYHLGVAPDGWDVLVRRLALPADLVRDAGVAIVNRAGRLQDLFRGRIVFPIYDPAGRPVALGGRLLPGGEGPKYLNSPDGPLYAKRRVLYGLNWAKAEAVETGELVVAEGYMDVIGLSMAGVGRAVAPCGTALGEEHLALARRFARRVVLAFDADRAGLAAAERLYDFERRHDLELAVVTLPEGSDPAEAALRSPDALRQAVAAAEPYLAFRLGRLIAGVATESAERRARAATEAAEAIAAHPDPLVRDAYEREVALRCRLSEARVHELVEETRRRQRRARGGEATGRSARRPGAGGESRPAGGQGERGALPGPAEERDRYVRSAGPRRDRSGRAREVDPAPPACGRRGPVRPDRPEDDWPEDDWPEGDWPGAERSTSDGAEEGPFAGPFSPDAPARTAEGPRPPRGARAPSVPADRRAGSEGRSLGAEPRGSAKGADRPGGPGISRLEREALRVAVLAPQIAAGRLTAACLASPLAKAAFRALIESETLHQALEVADAEVVGLLSGLVAEGEERLDPQALVRLAQEATRRRIAELDGLSRADPTRAEQASVAIAEAFGLLGALREEELNDLDEASTSWGVLEGLVAWLDQPVEEGR